MSNPSSPQLTESSGWYVVKLTEDQPCEVVAAEAVPAESDYIKRWGPFASQPDAMAKRVGLIRAGQCQPQ